MRRSRPASEISLHAETAFQRIEEACELDGLCGARVQCWDVHFIGMAPLAPRPHPSHRSISNSFRSPRTRRWWSRGNQATARPRRLAPAAVSRETGRWRTNVAIEAQHPPVTRSASAE
jgi:hypothetical protein